LAGGRREELHSFLAEREDVDPNVRVEIRDLEGAVVDTTALADELVEARLVDYPVAFCVDVVAVRIARRPPRRTPPSRSR
jgi:hypothetical protein